MTDVPAHAGVSPSGTATQPGEVGRPRARGGEPAAVLVATKREMTSPRTRG